MKIYARGLLTVLGLVAIGAATANSIAQRNEGRMVKIGLQLYSVRDECAKDLPAVLKAVGKMGYDGVEFAGYYGRSAPELRRMLDENGLKCCGTHIGLETLVGDQLEKTVEFNKILGNKYLVVPWMPEERRNSKAAWLETARLYNEISRKLEKHGMFIGYHNHTEEFKPLEGELPWDVFFGNTDPRVVMQFDTGNALSGGAKAAGFLARYPGRARTVHIKEHAANNPKALLGEGDIDWKEVLPLLKGKAGTEWFIIEYESDAYPPLVSVDKCLANFRKMIK